MYYEACVRVARRIIRAKEFEEICFCAKGEVAASLIQNNTWMCKSILNVCIFTRIQGEAKLICGVQLSRSHVPHHNRYSPLMLSAQEERGLE